MNKTSIWALCIAATMLSSCGVNAGKDASQGSQIGNTVGNIFNVITNGDALGNVLGSIIGSDKPTEAQLYGTWKYVQPGVAFTSESTLAKAGGEFAASQVKEKLLPQYQKLGISQTNTQFIINQDHTFQAKIAGMPISGSYTYNPQTFQLTLSSMLFSINAYVKGTSKGMSFLMESKKLLTLLQTMASLSGNSQLQTLGDLSSHYDGIRIGFDTSK